MKATLILENGSIFEGQSIGATDDRICELVFNTSMTGYQELLTDPTCAGQGIVMSYPLIGNYGVNEEDVESGRPWASAFIVRSLSYRGSNFRCQGSLDDYLRDNHITGIQGVDTRALTKILRNQGTMKGMLTCAENFSIPDVLEAIRAWKLDSAVETVTRKETEVLPAEGEQVCRVAVLDLGARNTMVDCLRRRGCEVTLLPAATTAETVLSGGYDGVVLSEGPGDPAENKAAVAEVRKLYESTLPLFACGLGHQLLALAAGGETEKLPYGHRGVNHPVRETATGKLFITGQNHGYVVKAAPAGASLSYTNLNDGTVEGLEYQRPNCFSVQFTVDRGTGKLFDRFVDMMKGGAQ